MKATFKDVSIRKFQIDDIGPLVDYWTKSSEDYWQERGIDKSKLFTEKEFSDYYQDSFKKNGGVSTVAVILYKENPVGVHTLTSLKENESGVFHAHIWKEEHRKIGIGYFSYILAAEFFLQTLNLKKIIFKTPKINLAANRVKEKLGIPKVGETLFEETVLIKPLKANLYELDLVLIQKIKSSNTFSS